MHPLGTRTHLTFSLGYERWRWLLEDNAPTLTTHVMRDRLKTAPNEQNLFEDVSLGLRDGYLTGSYGVMLKQRTSILMGLHDSCKGNNYTLTMYMNSSRSAKTRDYHVTHTIECSIL